MKSNIYNISTNVACMKRTILLGIILVGLIAGCISATTTDNPAVSPYPTTEAIFSNSYKDIYAADVIKMVEDGEDIVLVDARTPEEFAKRHIEGAILIPYTEIDQRHKELNASKDKEIIVYCTAGKRSEIAAQKLSQLGDTNVKNMRDGINGWIKSGGKTVVQ